MDGVLNGAGTSLVNSVNQAASGVLTATSLDVFVTIQGDLLTATGAVTLTPIPGRPHGDFTEYAILTITGDRASTPELPARSRLKDWLTPSLVPLFQPSM